MRSCRAAAPSSRSDRLPSAEACRTTATTTTCRGSSRTCWTGSDNISLIIIGSCVIDGKQLICSGTLGVALEFLQLSVGLFQPVRHLHLTVHRGGGGEVLEGLLRLASATVESPEARVAMSDEWTHAESGRKCQRVVVVPFCGFDVQRRPKPNDLAQQTERIRLVPELVTRTRHGKRLSGLRRCIVKAAN